MAPPRRGKNDGAVVPLPRAARPQAAQAARRRVLLRPSGRSLLVAAAVAAAVAGAYLAARETSLFAVRAIEVRGGSPRLAARVRAALEPVVGTSLLRVDGGEIERRLGGLPEVVSASYDREFPHTLRVVVRPEKPAAVLRQGASSWLVSARGRIMHPLAHPRRSHLPRVWVPRSASLSAGATLPDDEGGLAVRVLGSLQAARFSGVIRFASAEKGEVTLALRSGIEVRLGDPGDLRLKVAVARRILALARAGGSEPSYVDVSVPERPVAGEYNSQVEG